MKGWIKKRNSVKAKLASCKYVILKRSINCAYARFMLCTCLVFGFIVLNECVSISNVVVCNRTI